MSTGGDGRADPEMGERGYRLVDHTADVVLEAWGPTRAACLEEIAAGCCAIYSGGAPAAGRAPLQVAVSVPDELVPCLLEEIIFALDTLGRIPIGVEITHDSPTAVEGWIRVAERRAVDIVGPSPKAVARTGAGLVQTETGWRCRVTVDV